MVAASLASLQLGGCFAEVAKRAIWSPQRIAQERPDVRYHLIAIDFLPPAAIHASMQRVSALLAAGTSPDQSLTCASQHMLRKQSSGVG